MNKYKNKLKHDYFRRKKSKLRILDFFSISDNLECFKGTLLIIETHLLTKHAQKCKPIIRQLIKIVIISQILTTVKL